MSFINKIKIENVEYDIKDTNENEFLKNKGHFDTKEELPSVSQPSGEVGEHPSILETDLTTTNVNVDISELPNLTTLMGINMPYLFGFYVDRENYFFVSTTNPELIDGFSYSLDGNFNIHVKEGTSPMENFCIGHACYNGIYTSMPDMGQDNSPLLLPTFMEQILIDFNEGKRDMLTEPPCALPDIQPGILMSYLGGKGDIKIFGNFPTKVKYRPHLYRAFKRIGNMTGILSEAWEELQEDATRDSLTLSFANNYTYTDGMEALRFDENYNAYWITDEDGAKENDVAIVGDNNEMHVVNNGEWQRWNKSDSYTKTEIDAMLGEVENVLDNILNGG